MKPSQLAETFGTTRGNVSHCVSSLEAKGLLLRKIDPEDARAYQLTLKPQGKKCAVRVIGAFDKLQREFEQEIGKTALGEMLKSLRKLEALCVGETERLSGRVITECSAKDPGPSRWTPPLSSRTPHRCGRFFRSR